MNMALRPQMLHKWPADALGVVIKFAELGAVIYELQHRILCEATPTITAVVDCGGHERDVFQSFAMSGQRCESLICESDCASLDAQHAQFAASMRYGH